MGYKIAAYPLTLFSAAARAMQAALGDLGRGRTPDGLLDFEELQALVGFPEYRDEQARYAHEDEG